MDYQIFFFSTVFLLLCGVFLSYERFGAFIKLDKIVTEKFISHKPLGLIIGSITLIFGIISIIKPLDTPVVGDIIPAFLSIIGGIALISSKANMEYKGQNKFFKWIQEFIKTNIAIIGLLMLVFGILHAIFPTLLLL